MRYSYSIRGTLCGAGSLRRRGRSSGGRGFCVTALLLLLLELGEVLLCLLEGLLRLLDRRRGVEVACLLAPVEQLGGDRAGPGADDDERDVNRAAVLAEDLLAVWVGVKHTEVDQERLRVCDAVHL